MLLEYIQGVIKGYHIFKLVCVTKYNIQFCGKRIGVRIINMIIKYTTIKSVYTATTLKQARKSQLGKVTYEQPLIR